MTRFPEIGSEALEYGNGLTEKIFKVLVGEDIEIIGSRETVPVKNEKTTEKFEKDEF